MNHYSTNHINQRNCNKAEEISISNGISHTSSNLIFKERPKKLRKSNTTKGKFPLNFNFQDKDLLKNIEIASRTCGGKTNKKSNFYFTSINSQNSKDFSTQVFDNLTLQINC